MLVFSILLGAGAIASIVAAIVNVTRDGYGRVADRKLVRIY